MEINRGSKAETPSTTTLSRGSSSQPLILHSSPSATHSKPTNPVSIDIHQPFPYPTGFPGNYQIHYCTQTLPSSHPTGYLSNIQNHQQCTHTTPLANPTRPLGNMQSLLYTRPQPSSIPTLVLSSIQPPALSGRTQPFPYPTPALGPPLFYNPTRFLPRYPAYPTVTCQYPNPTIVVEINQPVYSGTEQISHPTGPLQNNPSVMSTQSYPVHLGHTERPMHPSLGLMPGFAPPYYNAATNEIIYKHSIFSTGNSSISGQQEEVSHQVTENVNSQPIITPMGVDDDGEPPLTTSSAGERGHGKIPVVAKEPTVRKSLVIEKPTMRTSSGPEAAPVETLLVTEKQHGATSLTVEKQGEISSNPVVFSALGCINETVDVVAAMGYDVSDGEFEDGEPEVQQPVKHKMFSFTLTKEEIEADFLAFSGALPPSEPRKRERSVERQLDGIFPGSYLGAALADEVGDSDDSQPPAKD